MPHFKKENPNPVMHDAELVNKFVMARTAHLSHPKDQQLHYEYAKAFLVLVKNEKDRGWLAWSELCDGLEVMFHAGMNDDIPLVLDWMRHYADTMAI